MKQMMYLIVSELISRDTEWARLYERLVQAKCPVDPRTGQRTGKLRIIGRVAGQLIETMYALLKTDAETVNKAPQGKEPPLLPSMSRSGIAAIARDTMSR